MLKQRYKATVETATGHWVIHFHAIEVVMCQMEIGIRSYPTSIVVLKILPSSHSSATWCIMVNVSMWCLPTT